ncbi:Hpt domain-containing protein [Fundidesulfovibrio soli]|uniref:Hpt domain-containing protein n=1 Tax=Fundidesulfovibrio soli TaxID=2922716 RepID=UPI001FB0029E|nr:Hpt domain-containing protein [Fundidesulfovibrio soli]
MGMTDAREDLAEAIREHFISALGLGESAARSLVGTSRVALRRSMTALGEAMNQGDRASTAFWAHNVKGNLLNTGLMELAGLALAIERAAEDASARLPMDTLDRLARELSRFLA